MLLEFARQDCGHHRRRRRSRAPHVTEAGRPWCHHRLPGHQRGWKLRDPNVSLTPCIIWLSRSPNALLSASAYGLRCTYAISSDLNLWLLGYSIQRSPTVSLCLGLDWFSKIYPQGSGAAWREVSHLQVRPDWPRRRVRGCGASKSRDRYSGHPHQQRRDRQRFLFPRHTRQWDFVFLFQYQLISKLKFQRRLSSPSRSTPWPTSGRSRRSWGTWWRGGAGTSSRWLAPAATPACTSSPTTAAQSSPPSGSTNRYSKSRETVFGACYAPSCSLMQWRQLLRTWRLDEQSVKL